MRLLRKTDEEKETSQAEACRLVGKKTTMMIKKEKADEEATQSRRDLQNL